MLRKIFWNIVNYLNKIMPKSDKIVLLYSGIEYKDNIKAVGDYLMKHGYNDKYKLYFGEYQRKEKYIYVNGEKTRVLSKLTSTIIFLVAGKILYAFNTLPIEPTKKQEAFQMWHGMPLKSIFNHCNTGKPIKYDYFSHILATSPQYAKIIAKCVPCDISRVIIMGQPKTDPLNNAIELDKKTIFWAPTFRKAKYWNQTDVNIESIVPLIPECEYEHFNEYLKQNNIHMIIKLHPMESCDDAFQLSLTNLSIYSHDSFSKNGFELYRCLSSASALITDYSSTYIDYLLLNRPIAFVINNIEEYSNNRGFIFERPIDYMKFRTYTILLKKFQKELTNLKIIVNASIIYLMIMMLLIQIQKDYWILWG